MRARSWSGALVALALGAALIGAPGARAQDGGVRAEADGGLAAEPAEAAAQAEPEEAPLPEGHAPEVSIAIEPRDGLVTGDAVHVVITARLREGDDVAVPRQSFGPFELHAQRHRDRPIDGGRREFVFEIDLLALEPGEHELPPLRLRVVTAEGAVGSVRTEPQRIVIGSLIANEPDAQPRPPTAPVAVMQDDYTLAWVLGIAAALLLTALATWLVARWWSRRPKKAAPPPPPRPAWEVALARLESLRARAGAMLEAGEHVALVDGVSDALREYLGARFGFNGLESTSDEVIARVSAARPSGATVHEVTALLGDCDLVKFAKAIPSHDECVRMIDGAVRIVRTTLSHVGAEYGGGVAPAPAPAPAIASAPTPIAPAPAPAEIAAPGAAPAPPPPKVPETREVPLVPEVPEVPEAPAMPAVVAAPDVVAGAEPGESLEVQRSHPARAIPITRESPAFVSPAPLLSRGAPITLPLFASSAEGLAPIIAASVLGAVEARALDPDWNGVVVVTLGPALPDDAAAGQALHAVHADVTSKLATRRTMQGTPVRLVIEHLHEPARDAALEGRDARKTVYGAPEQPPAQTLVGNAFGSEAFGGEAIARERSEEDPR